jgi:hypothetical protein
VQCKCGLGWRKNGASNKSFSPQFAGSRLGKHLCTLIRALSSVATFGCATRHATLDFTAPSSARRVSIYTRGTVMIGSERDTILNNRIHFSSSDCARCFLESTTSLPPIGVLTHGRKVSFQ